MREGPVQPKGYQQITSLAAAVALTVPTGSRYAMLKCTAQSVRIRDDGTDPTTAIGMLIDVGDELWYTGKLSRVKVIQTAVSATLDVLYYG